MFINYVPCWIWNWTKICYYSYYTLSLYFAISGPKALPKWLENSNALAPFHFAVGESMRKSAERNNMFHLLYSSPYSASDPSRPSHTPLHHFYLAAGPPESAHSNPSCSNPPKIQMGQVISLSFFSFWKNPQLLSHIQIGCVWHARLFIICFPDFISLTHLTLLNAIANYVHIFFSLLHALSHVHLSVLKHLVANFHMT